jgi:hypothetical protein
MDSTFQGYDLHPPGGGNDFAVVSDFGYRTAAPKMTEQDCCNICAGFDGCSAFTLSPANTHEIQPACYLKNANAKSGSFPSTGYISGLVDNADKRRLEEGVL